MSRIAQPVESMASIPTHDWWPDAPWHERIDGRPVDVERTARFAGEGLRVRCSPTTPLDLCGSKPTPVYLSKKVSPWWKPLPAIRVPLPPVVHMNLRNPDCQVFFLDEEAGLYYELSAFRATPWFNPYRWACDSAYVWDLNRPWEDQPGGTSASDIPVGPLVPSVAQLEAGEVNHALAFVCAGLGPTGQSDGYSSAPPVGYARATDGRIPDHPIRAGELIQIDPALAPTPRNRQEETILTTLEEHGAVCTDMTDYYAGHCLRMPFDADLDVALDLNASMFKVVAA